ncbi:MAG: hypothetical protein B6D46_00255 [Polyangiaceae bacterium UTPRO1]|jgi:tetratricopeptide (TPR) repeat protein|nr:tetratricopeptide repeat protein [Myxococcales bacterium]OQY69407.1 MAG: hypothetical protein B6D46_00255 [Polyangiaceae bacterium UTPRO1]
MSSRASTPARRRPPSSAGKAPAAASAPAARAWRLAAAAAFAVGVLAYANTLGHGFVWDDPIWLDQKLRFYRSPLDAFFEPEFMPMRQVYRPLSQLTYWIDLSLWGRNAFGFHLTSVLMHALNGALLVRLGRALGFRSAAALAAAVLFLVHPIQPESVAWITNRVDILATIFVLLTLLGSWRSVSATTLALVAAASFAAAASKETGCVVPALVAAAVAWVRPRHSGESLRTVALLPLASLAGIVPYFLLRPEVAGIGVPLDSLGRETLGRLVGSFGYQVSRLLAPIGFAPYVAHVPENAATLAAAAFGAVAAGFGVLAPDAGGRRRFALAWLLVAAALPVLAAIADFTSVPVAEHRLYLAVGGLALLAGTGLERWRPATTTTYGALAVAAALAVVAAVTIRRNEYWRDELTLWRAVVAGTSDEPAPYMNLGLALAAAGRSAEAEAAYRRALALAPSDLTRQRTCIDLGLVLVERGELAEAEELFTAANRIGGHAVAYRGLALVARRRGQAAQRRGDIATAESEQQRGLAAVQRALAINPRYPQGYATLAGILYDAGRYRDALRNYQQAAAIAGDDAVGREAAANARQLGDWLATHPEAP